MQSCKLGVKLKLKSNGKVQINFNTQRSKLLFNFIMFTGCGEESHYIKFWIPNIIFLEKADGKIITTYLTVPSLG